MSEVTKAAYKRFYEKNKEIFEDLKYFGKLKGIQAGQTKINYKDINGCKRDTLITIKSLEKPTLSCGIASGSTVEFTWTPTSLTTNYDVSYGNIKTTGSSDTLTALTKYTARGLALGDSIWLKIQSKGTGCYLTDSIVCVAKKCPKPEIDVQPLSKVVCDKDVVEFEVIKTVEIDESIFYKLIFSI
jgi:hypothetical protein